MAKKSIFIKNLLTTASALAVLAGGTQSALANERVVTASPAVVTGGVNMGGVFNDDDALKVVPAVPGTPIAISVSAAARRVTGLNLNNNVGVTLNVDQNLSLGSVVPNGGAAATAPTLAVTVANTKVLTLTGKNTNSTGGVPTDNYTGLGPVTLSGATAKVVINSAANAVQTFTNTFDGPGLIEVNTAAVFNETIGATTQLADVKITAGVPATFNKNVKATTISMSNAGAIMNIGAAAVNTGVVVTGNIVSSGGGNHGIINFKGSDASVVGNIGVAGTAVDQVNIDNGVNATVTGNIAANTGIKFMGATAHLTLASGAANVRTITGPILANAANDGILEFIDNGVVNGDIGAGGAIGKLIIGGTVELQGAVTKTANGIELGNVASILKLSTANQTITSDIKNSSGTDGKGIVQLTNGNDYTIKGNIGADGAQLEAINLEGNANLILEKAVLDLYVKNIAASAGANGHVRIIADTANIYGDIGTAANKLAAVDVYQSVAGGAAPVTFNLKGGKIYATTFEMSANAPTNNVLALEQGSEVHANIATNNANNGIILVKGDATIDGTIGVGNAINKIVFDANSNGKTLTVTKNTIGTDGVGNGIDFSAAGADGTIALTEVATTVLRTPILIGNNANGQGSIKVNQADAGKTVEIQGTIGDFASVDANTKALKLLEVKGGADIKLTNPLAVATAGAYIKKIDIGDKDVKLILSDTSAGTYKIDEFAHADGKGTVEFANDTVLKAGTVFSKTDTNKLNVVKLNGNRTVTIEDGINIAAVNGIQNNVASEGTLIFKGSSVVDAIVGQNNPFKAIEIKGEGESVDFKQDVKLTQAAGAGNGLITISKDATGIFRGDIKGKFIDGETANDQGTVNFANIIAKEVDLAIGQNKTLNTVQLSGTDVTFKQKVNASNFKFTNAAGATTAKFIVDNPAGNLDIDLNDTVSTNSATHQHNIQYIMKTPANAGIVTFKANKDVATEANQFGNYIIDDKMIFKVNTTNFLSGITTATASKGKVEFVKNGATTLNLGEIDKSLEKVTFTTSGTVRGVLNADDISVAAGQTVTLQDSTFISANGMKLDANSIAAFKGDANVKSSIEGAADKQGTVTFANGANINGAPLGGTALKQITFSSDDKADVAFVNEDLTATNITINGLTFKPTNDITLTGASVIKGTTLDLSNNKNVTLTGGNSTVSGNIGVIVNLSAADQNSLGGIIVDGATSKLNASGITGFQITIANDNADLPGVDARTFTLISTTGGADLTSFNQSVVANVIGGNKFAKWTFDASTGKLTQINNAAAALQAIVAGGSTNLLVDAARIGDAKNVSDARAVQTDLGKMATSEQIKDALQRLSNPITTAASAVSGAITGAGQATLNRVGELSPHPTAGIQTADSGVSGVNAGDGDDRTRYGAWVSPFYNVSNQSERSGTPGYKSTSYGATIGADTMANADMSLGIALSYLKTEVKHKNFKSGDKTKADTYMFSVYGIQQLTTEWFLQGVATFSSSKIKNSEKRGTSTGYQIAKGEYDATSYGTELLFGYLHSLGDLKVTPLGGIAASRFNDGGYKETGTKSQNMTITKKAVTKLEGVLGARIEMANIYSAEGMEVVPEFHGYARHDFLNQKAQVTTKLEGLNQQFTPKAPKTNKTMFNLGTSLNSKSGMYEYGAGYDVSLSNKFVGHQGTIKVRVNF